MLCVSQFDQFPEDGKHVESDPQEKRKPDFKSYVEGKSRSTETLSPGELL